jgi:glucose-6-phosphate 1-epimerase
MTALEEQAAALQAEFGRAGAIAFAVSPLGGVIARLTAANGRAVVALQGAQVLSWVPAGGGRDVLWCSALARLGTGKAVRGGIPVCWPWFGPHPDAALGLPAHGFVRAAPWHVERVEAGGRETSITFGVELTADQQAILGSGISVALRVTLAADLNVELTTRNDGGATFELSEALHTYLAIGDIASVLIHGLDGRSYLDQVTGKDSVQSGSIAFKQETDRIYWDVSEPLLIADTTYGRSLDVASTGSASTVIWNPWQEKAERLGDVPPGGFRDFVCAETANVAPHNIVRVAPGSSHRIACRIVCTKT